MCQLFILLAALGLSTLHVRAEDWPKYRHDLANTGMSRESFVESANIASLKFKWKFGTDGNISASPAVATVNQRSMAFIGNWTGSFYGVDAVTGAKIWSWSIPASDRTGGRCTTGANSCPIPSSPALNGNRTLVYFGAASGYLYALHTGDGSLAWKVQLGKPENGAAIWASPVVYEGTVYIGLASWGDNPCVSGHLEAFNATTGALVWDLPTIDPTTCSGTNCVGAGVWASAAIDTTNNILYVGTGNPGHTCNPSTPNATRYPDSILAVNASTGALLNYFTAVVNDTNDFDFGSSPILHTSGVVNQCTNASALTNWVSEPSKNGTVYTRAVGAAGLSGTGTSQHLDGTELIASPGLRSYRVTSACGTSLTTTTYTNRILVATKGGKLYNLNQTSAGTESVRWSIQLTTVTNVDQGRAFSAPAQIKDLTFVGDNSGALNAIRISDGSVVWSYMTGGAVTSGPAISNGRIYVGSFDYNLYAFSMNAQ